MKKLVVATLLLIACSCQKQAFQNPEAKQANDQSEESSISSVSLSLSKDPDFTKLVSISQPVIRSFRTQQKFPEFKDGRLLFKECKTLYAKMGFRDSTECVQWFLTAYELSDSLAGKYPDATQQDYTGAFVVDPKTACQDKATGTFLMDMAKCGAFGVIPVVGPALAGTCMIGALIVFNGAMASCETTPLP